jgi:hypothetical protein
MSDTNDDILYMRRLAEQGRRGTIAGGLFLGTAGLVFGLACIVQWVLIRGHQPAIWLAYLWAGAFLLYGVVWLSLFLRLQRHCQPAAAGTSHMAFGALWLGCAAGILVSSAAITIVVHVTGNASAQQLYAPVIFGFYGVARCGIGILAHRKWMLAVAAAAFVSALALAGLADDTRAFLVMGVALLLTLALPGFKLTLEEPC